ncbi:MAG TPA: hypothetical protein VFQ85_16370 [Mycobacteriales bacterium]|jgi:hypothetical protein|nr:hypothetical protein [Mycobacteriales bacterium]
MSDLEIARDDLALDALAAGELPDGDDAAFGLLHALRAELDEAVAPAAPVVVPLRPRRRRSATLIALSAAAGLVLGGLTAGAVVAADRPGEMLYAAHKAVLGASTPTAADKVTAVMDRAADALARGDRPGARRLLAQALAMVPAVSEEQRAALLQRHATLSRYALDPVPTATPSPDRHGGRTPTATRSAEPGDDNGGTSGTSGTSGSDDSGSDDSSGTSGSGTSGSGDTSGTSGTSGSGDTSGSDSTSGSSGGSDDGGSSGSGKTVLATPTVDSGGHGGDDGTSGGDDH